MRIFTHRSRIIGLPVIIIVVIVIFISILHRSNLSIGVGFRIKQEYETATQTSESDFDFPAPHFLEINELRPEENTEPRSWRMLGCYQLSAVPSQTLMKSSESHSISHCLEICNRSTVLSMYGENGNCYCTNSFSAFNSSENCKTNAQTKSRPRVWVAHPGNVTGLMIEQSQILSRTCECAEYRCLHIICRVKESDTLQACWTGPRRVDLTPYLMKGSTCPRSLYTILPAIAQQRVDTTEVAYVYCVPQSHLIGFWPVKSCTIFKKSHQNRMFTIKPPINQDFIKMQIAPRANQQRVVISGYYRSGSTLSSELFLANPYSKLFYEPLRAAGHDKFVPEYNLPEQSISSASHYQARRAMEDILHCRLYTLPSNTFISGIEEDHVGPEGCLTSWTDCLSIERNTCVSRLGISAKVIRINTESLNDIIQSSIPDLKVIGLFRDPRAMYRSWKIGAMRSIHHLTKETELDKLLPMIKTLCTEQENDHRAIIKMSKLYKNQTYVLHYEDLVFDPHSQAIHLYHELGLGDPPEEVLAGYAKLVHDEDVSKHHKTHEDRYGVIKNRKGRDIAYEWKKQLEWKEIEAIDNVCSNSYRYTGYEPVYDETQLENLTNYHRTFLFDV